MGLQPSTLMIIIHNIVSSLAQMQRPMPPGSQPMVGVPPNQMMIGQRPTALPPAMPPTLPPRPPMVPEQMALGQRPGMPVASNQGVQANPAVISMVRQPGMIQQSNIVASGQGMVVNQRVCKTSLLYVYYII